MSGEGIKLIVGLGNPGDEYKDSRHNAGWWLIDELSRHGVNLKLDKKFFGYVGRVSLSGRDVWLLKPITYMNKSGQSVLALANYYKILPEQILVAHDELDLPVSEVRLKLGGGHAGHNGLRDIMSRLSAKNYWRLRMGIDRPRQKGPVANYVLGRMPMSEREMLERCCDDVEKILPDLLQGDFSRAMNYLHTKKI